MDQQLSWTFGARDSQLSITQSTNAIRLLSGLMPALSCELVPMTSPGDQDRQTDLRLSDPDFFTRYLDNAVRDGDIAAALHSAKDLPDPVPDFLDWFWLPWAEDPRDALILRPGETIQDLPPNPIAGISSERRDEWCRTHLPGAINKPIRGNIEHRLEQLDNGDFDALIMAGAALNRLGLEHRATQWIPLHELPVPDGQGYLAVTFRAGDRRLQILRQLLVPGVTFVGAGPGDPALCTQAGIQALQQADVCLYDALAPSQLLDHLPATAKAIFVGKRRNTYSVGRRDLDRLILDYARQGKRVVRLKGGDPGIFGRLAQEVGILQRHSLPFRVIPGISSMLAATSSTGLMLTRRGVSRGFTVVTPEQLGESTGVGFGEQQKLPLILFMAVARLPDVVADLTANGRSVDEPATIVYGASTANRTIVTATLGTIVEATADCETPLPALLLVGQNFSADHLYPAAESGLGGQRVLLTCSQRILPAAIDQTQRLGGVPVPLPLIRLTPEPAATSDLTALRDKAWDWIVLTSPNAADTLVQLMNEHQIDLRLLPGILHCGQGTADALARHGLHDTTGPTAKYSADALLEHVRDHIKSGDRVLRLRSDLAPTTVGDQIATLGATVTDTILYHNTPIDQTVELPPHEAIFFASSSAIDAFVSAWSTAAFDGKTIVVIGVPTATALRQHGREPDVIAHEATATDALWSLAAHRTAQRLRAL